MKTVRLYTITQHNIGKDFPLVDYPELRCYENYSKRKDIKRINVEQYFRGIGKDYKDYIKLAYGPVFGMTDSRNGFLYENKNTEEILIVDENDIPITYATCDVIRADLDGICKVDTNTSATVITTHKEMIELSNDPIYNDLIRDQWVLDKSFLLID